MGIFEHILGNALTGGLFGLIGNIATKLFAYLDTKQRFSEQQAQWDYRTECLRLRAPLATAPVPDAQDMLALDRSLKDDAALGSSYRWVDAVRALVRPALTCGLAATLAVAFFAMKSGDPERGYVIDSLVFAGVSAIAWWFGDRAPRRAR